MGLDITAYRKLTKIDALFNADGEPVNPTTREPIEDDYVQIYLNPDYPGRGEGLEDRAIYSYGEGEHVFSRGYGGYGHWRETLAELAGYPMSSYKMYGRSYPSRAAALWNGEVTEGPFAELINFSDCEGTIGPVVAAKLLRDFIEWDERAKAGGDDYFYKGYGEMRRGLEIAADGGALKFS